MEHILSFAAEYDMLPPGGLLICALSGGRDSVALLHFLKTQGFRVVAAHFNHHLRDTARRDAEFCRDLCRDWGVPFFTWGKRVGECPGNTEANGREARYAYLEHLAAGLSAARILTAHTADDNLETLLLHLARGCGLKGLTGIQPRRGKLARPMLHTTEEAVARYLRENGLTFVTDETNLDDAYARNRLRHRAVPALVSVNPRAVEVSVRLFDALRADEAYLAGQAEEALRRVGPQGVDALPAALRYRAGQLLASRPAEAGEPPLDFSPRQAVLGEQEAGPLWRLTLRTVPAAPADPPTPLRFFLSLPALARAAGEPPSACPEGEPGEEGSPLPGLILRPRRAGDRLHPPFRTGKTVKKWLNEVGVPPALRGAVPVLAAGEAVAAVGGLGPGRDFLAAPGGPALECLWTPAGAGSGENRENAPETACK